MRKHKVKAWNFLWSAIELMSVQDEKWNKYHSDSIVLDLVLLVHGISASFNKKPVEMQEDTS
jgi:hypothetical protein